MGLSATLSTSVELSEELQQRLSAVLGTYRELKIDADLLEAQMDEETAKVFAILTEEGIEKVKIDDIMLAMVGGHTSKLNKEKFVQLGGSLKTLDAATEKKPKKKYVKITIGKDKVGPEEDA